eukprot:762890-Hanusia_phi.AAC.3
MEDSWLLLSPTAASRLKFSPETHPRRISSPARLQDPPPRLLGCSLQAVVSGSSGNVLIGRDQLDLVGIIHLHLVFA